jgi:hypothetical protein
MQKIPNPRRWILIVIVLLLALVWATPVLADYLGPNRTVTITVPSCHVNLYECMLLNGKYKWIGSIC